VNQIIPYPLWIGHAGDGRDYRRILDAGIQAIVQVAAEEPALQPPRDLVYCRVPLVDGPGNPPVLLTSAVRTVFGFVQAGMPTLVCCGAGRSRAPAIGAAGLALSLNLPPAQCLEMVVRQHPSDVSPGFWAEVVKV
jgi:hypothetical protein